MDDSANKTEEQAAAASAPEGTKATSTVDDATPADISAPAATTPKPADAPTTATSAQSPGQKAKLSVQEIEQRLLKMPLEKRIIDRLYNLRKELIINEDLMLTKVFRGNINNAYYKRWLRETNSIHKCVVKYKRRLKKLRNKEIA